MAGGEGKVREGQGGALVLAGRRTVSNAGRKTVGILKTDVELFGGFDMQTFAQKPRWAIAQELEQQYKIENVDPASDYPEGLDCLLVPQASSLEQEPMDRLQQWILAGNPTLLFEDPQPLGAPGTAAERLRVFE